MEQNKEDELQKLWSKKLGLAESEPRIQDLQFSENIRRNEILLFTNGSWGLNSASAWQYFEIKNKKLLSAKTKHVEESSGTGADISETVDVSQQQRRAYENINIVFW